MVRGFSGGDTRFWRDAWNVLERFLVQGVCLGSILVKQGSLRRKPSERGGNGVELDLFNLEIVAILMDHVVRPEKTERKVLDGRISHHQRRVRAREPGR